MKLKGILLEYGDLGTRFQERELELIYKVLADHKETLEISEINNLAREVAEREDWTRNAGSARFVLARMHVLFHGEAPGGVKESTATEWMTPSKIMDRWASAKGINVNDKIQMALRELRGRKAKIKPEDAKQAMVAYYKQNKSALPGDIGSKRKEILADIQAGLTAQEAFARHS